MNKPPAVSASVIRPLNGDVKSESKSVTLAPRYDDANMMMISDHCVGDQGNAVILSPELNYFFKGRDSNIAFLPDSSAAP